MRRWIFAIFASILIAFSANATVNDGHITTTVGYVTHELDTRQDEFPAQSGTKAMTFGDDAGEIGAREVKSDLGSSTSDDSLPTVSAVNTGLGTKQNTIAAGNANKVLTYTGVAGNVGAKGIYQNSGTYASQMDSLVTAGTFNTALRNGLESEFVCAETDPSNGQCWAWLINTNGGAWNYFYMDDIPETAKIVRNADGTLTVSPAGGDNNSVNTTKTLAQLAPGLEVGKLYKYSINSTATNKRMYLGSPPQSYWDNGEAKIVTSDMLNSVVYFYATGGNPTATISKIQITGFESNAQTGSTTILPTGYIPVGYIQNAASTRVSTGITPDQDDVEMEIRYRCNTTNSNYIFQSRADSDAPIFGFSGSQTGAKMNGCWNGCATSTITRTVGHVYKMNLKVKDGKLILSVLDETTGQSDVKSINKTFSIPPTPMYIFGNYAGNNIASGHRVYSAWIKVNGQYVMNYIPAVYNNAAGFYDTVSGTFKGATTGSLTPGVAKNNNLYLPQNQ